MDPELYLFYPQGEELISSVEGAKLPELLASPVHWPVELAIVHPHLDCAVEALSYWRQQLPFIPITLVSESTEKEHQSLEEHTQLPLDVIKQQLKIHRIISHQFSQYKFLEPAQFKIKLGQVLKSYVAFETQSRLEEIVLPAATTDQQDLQEDLSSFIPIELKFLMHDLPCHFALYIKGPGERFYKILYAGDYFSKERFEQYQKATVTHFYLFSDELKNYLNYCSEVQQTLQEHREQSHRMAISPHQQLPVEQLQHFSDQLMELFKREGVKDQSLHFAKKFLKLGQKLIGQLQRECDATMRAILDSCLQAEHSCACALVTGLFVEALQLDNLQLKEDLAVAALLHDIGFTQLPRALREIPFDQLNEIQQKQYQSHPEVGYELLLPLSGISEGIKQAVRCHHERKNAKGYPRHLAPSEISMMSEIIGLCEEYVEFHQIFDSSQRKKFKQFFEEQLQFEFSAALTEVFRRCFLNF